MHLTYYFLQTKLIISFYSKMSYMERRLSVKLLRFLLFHGIRRREASPTILKDIILFRMLAISHFAAITKSSIFFFFSSARMRKKMLVFFLYHNQWENNGRLIFSSVPNIIGYCVNNQIWKTFSSSLNKSIQGKRLLYRELLLCFYPLISKYLTFWYIIYSYLKIGANALIKHLPH